MKKITITGSEGLLGKDISKFLEKIRGNGKKKIWPAEIPNQKKLRQIFC